MPKYPWEQPAVVEQCEKAPYRNVWVVRDDLLEGGTKVRVLPHIVKGAEEVVFGGPFCGGAPLALSVLAKYTKVKVTLFFAKRTRWHPRQQLAKANGARLIAVPMGFMTHVQHRAAKYAKRKGALFLPLGYDVPESEPIIIEAAQAALKSLGEFAQLYTACASGMLTRCLALAFPSSEIVGVCVGLKSRWAKQAFPPNVRLVEWPTVLGTPAKGEPPPFDCCPYYERKAWEVLKREALPGRTVFWNVLGNAGVAS